MSLVRELLEDWFKDLEPFKKRKCPRCQSNNVHKLDKVKPGVVGRIFEVVFFPVQIVLFLFPFSVRAQKFRCNQCGCQWKRSPWTDDDVSL